VNQLAPLPHYFNITNAYDLLKDLRDTPMLPHYNLASLDLTNLYSNIPVKETKVIFANILTHNLIASQTQHELLRWFDIITNKNYFTHGNHMVLQHDGVTMGAPSSGLIAELFFKFLFS